MRSIAVFILTYNEEKHLARALASVASFASEVHVIDSYSTDQTVAIAEAHGARVVQRAWKNQADQFQWALDTLKIDCDWIMRLDADEVIEPDLAATIRRDLPQLGSDMVAVTLDRKHIFLGRWIRHGGRYPLTLVRIWRRGMGRIEQRWMDEHVVVEGGRIAHFSGGFADHNLGDLTYFTDKHNQYATREAVDVLNARYGLFPRDTAVSSASAGGQAAVKRWIKETVYNQLPFWMAPLGYFLYRFIFQLGFMDGYQGLIYHVLQGYWYRFLVAAKVVEFDRELKTCSSAQERLAALSRLSGLKLSD